MFLSGQRSHIWATRRNPVSVTTKRCFLQPNLISDNMLTNLAWIRRPVSHHHNQRQHVTLDWKLWLTFTLWIGPYSRVVRLASGCDHHLSPLVLHPPAWGPSPPVDQTTPTWRRKNPDWWEWAQFWSELKVSYWIMCWRHFICFNSGD